MLQIIDELKFEEMNLIRVKNEFETLDASPMDFFQFLGFEEINLPWRYKIFGVDGDGSEFTEKKDFKAHNQSKLNAFKVITAQF